MSHPDAGGAPAHDRVSASERAQTPARWMVLLTALFAALPYARTIGYPFVYDDGAIIVANTPLHAPSGLITGWTLPYWPVSVSGPAGLYRPLVEFVYAALWNLGAGRPWPFHLYAVAVNVACAVALLFVLARAIPVRAALIGALLFAADPVHVEAVASIVGSAEALVTLLALAVVALMWRADDGTPPGAPWSWRASMAIAVAYALALATKESAAAIPAIAFASVWGWRASSDDATSVVALVQRGWRCWVACAAFLAIMIVARGAVLGTLTPPASAIADGLVGASIGTRLWTMIGAWPRVAALLFWPAHLMMHYGPSAIVPRSAPDPRTLASIASVALAAAVAARLARHGDRRPTVALAWIALGYLPASNLLVPTGQLLAERTLYLPSVGAVMLVAWLVALGLAWLERREARPAITVVQAAAAAVCVAAALRAFTGSAVWRAGDVLFQSGIAADPRAFHPRIQLARWYGRHHEESRAIAEMDTAYRLAPTKEDLAFEYATHLLADHRAAEALGVLRTASAVIDTSARLRLTYLSTLLKVEGPRAVIDDVEHHTGHDAGGALTDVVLGDSFAQLDMADSSLAAYGRASRASPDDASIRVLLARELARSGRRQEADAQLDTAASLGAPNIAVERARITASGAQ